MFNAKILIDSLSPEDARLTTFEVTFPRFILAEVNTHRMLSRNSASSRAIPVKKAIEAVEIDPFIPSQFGKNRPGMSWDANDVLGDEEAEEAKVVWEGALNDALHAAKALESLGVHKALANRILEPFKWHTALITATEWDNFFALRTHPEAQEEFRTIAMMMQTLYEENTPKRIPYGAWHLPLVDPFEIYGNARMPCDLTGYCYIDWDYWKKVSVGRCARVSYLTHDGKRAPIKDVELHDRLLTNGHLSPFEHVATPSIDPYVWSGNIKGYAQYRKFIPNEANFALAMAADLV